MASFPQIGQICPYLDRLDTVIEGGYCRMCSREVHDLTFMDDRERTAFLAACGGDACVSYTMYVKPGLAMALIAASAAVLAAPDMALAGHQQGARGHHRSRPVPVANIPVVVAGGITAPVVARPADPVPPPPPPPLFPPKKQD